MKKRWLGTVTALLLATTLSACAVLTSSQVAEVKKFADASDEFSAVPGSLASSYGALLRDEKLLALCRHQYGASIGGAVDIAKANMAWGEIRDAYTLEHQFSDAGKRMDAALLVLKDYSKLLTLLVSDEMTAQMGQSAVDLGKALDDATAAYNNQYRTSITSMGGEVGQFVRAAGGVYVRHRQTEILKETVQKADPLVQGLMSDLEDIAQNRFKEDFINYEKNFLGPEFQSIANNKHQVDLPLVYAVYDDLARARTSVELCDDVAAAARAYARAHKVLVEKTRSRMHLSEAVEEIKTLGQEVVAAKKAKEQIGK